MGSMAGMPKQILVLALTHHVLRPNQMFVQFVNNKYMIDSQNWLRGRW
jgi:hypothetical protein